MKLSLIFQPLFSFLAEEGPQEGAKAIDPFSGGASPLTTLLLVVLLIIIIWFLLRMQVSQVDTSDLEHGDHDHDAHHAEAHEEPAASEQSSPDDLRKLEGIGPKVQAVLNEAGISTFAQLAETAVDKLQEILDAADYQYMNPGSWPEQAKLAAAGDWDALKALQEELDGGR